MSTGCAVRKCVVWDLDGSVWDGVLMEDQTIQPRADALHLIRVFDERGILQAVASRNEPERALAALENLGLREYFLCTQIHWGPKSESLRIIAEELDIAPDTMAFIDDQQFERDEVRSRWPAVLCVDASDLRRLAERPEFNPLWSTAEARQRRKSYVAGLERTTAEKTFQGAPDAFLRSSNLHLTVERATLPDLDRIEELTVRTHQLNSTGRLFDRETLERLIASPSHLVLVASLTDRFGAYGRIALAVIDRSGHDWLVQLLLTSCRVLSRGVGTHFLSCLVRTASKRGVRLRAEFIPTPVNRSTLVMLRFAGFVPGGTPGVLEWRHRLPPDLPDWLKLSASDLDLI